MIYLDKWTRFAASVFEEDNKKVTRIGMLVQGESWKFIQKEVTGDANFRADNVFFGYIKGVQNYFQLLQSDKKITIEESIPGKKS